MIGIHTRTSIAIYPTGIYKRLNCSEYNKRCIERIKIPSTLYSDNDGTLTWTLETYQSKNQLQNENENENETWKKRTNLIFWRQGVPNEQGCKTKVEELLQYLDKIGWRSPPKLKEGTVTSTFKSNKPLTFKVKEIKNWSKEINQDQVWNSFEAIRDLQDMADALDSTSRVVLRKIKNLNAKYYNNNNTSSSSSKEETNETKDPWKVIKDYSRTKSIDQHALWNDETNETTSEPDVVHQIWKRHFGNLLAIDPSGHGRDWEWKWEPDVIPTWHLGVDMESDLSWHTIARTLKLMANGKSPGNDGIPPEWFKSAISKTALITRNCSPENPFANAIWRIIKSIWKREEIPTKWNLAEIVPVPKKGDLSKPGNYRGISIMNSALKVFCTILAGKIATFVERHEILGKEQSAFRKYEETVSQTLALTEIIEQRKKRGLATHVAFLDLTKAYDKVPHSALLWRCKSVLPKKLWSLVKALYQDPRFTIKQLRKSPFSNFSIESLPVLTGVRQGCPTSPILFNLFIRDILKDCKGVSIPGIDEKCPGLLFADDTVVFGETEKELQDSLDSISEWCKKWEMELNVGKCAIMSIYPNLMEREWNEDELDEDELDSFYPVNSSEGKSWERQKREKMERDVKLKATLETVSLWTWKIGNETVPVVDEFKYLGTIINPHTERSRMIKARGELGRIALKTHETFLKDPMIEAHCKRLVIKGIIIPTISFGIEIWGLESGATSHLQPIIEEAWKMANLRMNEIPMISDLANKARLRAWEKWPELKTWIAKLIRRGNWMNETVEWSVEMERRGGIIPPPIRPKILVIKRSAKRKSTFIWDRKTKVYCWSFVENFERAGEIGKKRKRLDDDDDANINTKRHKVEVRKHLLEERVEPPAKRYVTVEEWIKREKQINNIF